MKVYIDTTSAESYRQFLQIKQLPRYEFNGREAWFPDEYANQIDGVCDPSLGDELDYKPPSWMFDYQRDITRIAIEKRKYAVFADCGLGKTAMLLEFAYHAAADTGKPVLIVSPLMVCKQTHDEATKFFGRELEIVKSGDLSEWLTTGTGVAITNYEAFNNCQDGRRLGGIILDESSMLKSHYGKWGTSLIEFGKGVPYKLACTGTPAPNDRIEYANHAVFLDRFQTVNQFLATYFINRGQTQDRWALKPHALGAFYRSLSDWCIFLTNPATYGWKDNCGTLPPINVHVHDVPMTDDQKLLCANMTGDLFVSDVGGITHRGKLSRIGKGWANGSRIDTNKNKYIAELIASWPDESTIVWCHYNDEQDQVAASIPDCRSITGSTPMIERQMIVQDFLDGHVKTIVTKPKILGFGLNLQICTRQIFSGLNDSYESYYQAVKRSNRVGSKYPLNVHIPVTEAERPMIETVLRKASRVEQDTREQELIFSKSIA